MLSDFVYSSNAVRKPEARDLVLSFSGRSRSVVGKLLLSRGYSLTERYLYVMSHVNVRMVTS